VKQAATAGIGFGLAGFAAPRASAAAQAVPRRIAANDKIAVAVIGTNGRGIAHINCLTGLAGAEVAWRVGRELQCDPANGHIKNDPEAMKLWRRDYEKGWGPKV